VGRICGLETEGENFWGFKKKKKKKIPPPKKGPTLLKKF